MTITGIIKNIEHDNTFHEKKIVTLYPNKKETVFIEFRGRNMALLSRVKQDDEIAVDVWFDAEISRKSGIRYNNIVACDLRKISV